MSLEQALTARGATLVDLDGVPVPRRFSTLEAEVSALRRSVGLSALPHLTCLRIAGAGAAAALDPLCPIDLSLPSGAMQKTLLLHEDGRIFADLTLCKDDDAFLLLAEGTPPGAIAAHLSPHLRADAALEDWSATHLLLSLNGPLAADVMMELAGPEIMGFPPMSFYRPTERRTYLHADRIGEDGYDLLVPRAEGERYFTRLLEVGEAFGMLPVGLEALAHAARENGVFDIHRQGQTDLTPLELGLLDRLSWDKEFLGKAALLRRKEAGCGARPGSLVSEGVGRRDP